MELPYTIFALGDAQLHQLHTDGGKVCAPAHCRRPTLLTWLPKLGNTYSAFDQCGLRPALATPSYSLTPCDFPRPPPQLFIMSEVATQLFQESPIAFGKVRARSPHIPKCGGFRIDTTLCPNCATPSRPIPTSRLARLPPATPSFAEATYSVTTCTECGAYLRLLLPHVSDTALIPPSL
jgi:hypothetical protein